MLMSGLNGCSNLIGQKEGALTIGRYVLKDKKRRRRRRRTVGLPRENGELLSGGNRRL